MAAEKRIPRWLFDQLTPEQQEEAKNLLFDENMRVGDVAEYFDVPNNPYKGVVKRDRVVMSDSEKLQVLKDLAQEFGRPLNSSEYDKIAIERGNIPRAVAFGNMGSWKKVTELAGLDSSGIVERPAKDIEGRFGKDDIVLDVSEFDKLRAQQYREENPEKVKEMSKKYILAHPEEVKARKKEWNESERGKELNKARDDRRYAIAKAQEEQIAEELGFDKDIVHNANPTSEELEQKKVVRDEYLRRREAGEIGGGRLLPKITGFEDIFLEKKEDRGIPDEFTGAELGNGFLSGGEELYNKIMTPAFMDELARVGRERAQRDEVRAAEKAQKEAVDAAERARRDAIAEAERAKEAAEWAEAKKYVREAKRAEEQEAEYEDILESADIDKLDFVRKRLLYARLV